MAVNSSYSTTIRSGVSYFRITSLTFLTTDPAYHSTVVNGQGGVKSAYGARYNYPGVETVYLTEDVETCFAEKMFYFSREVIGLMDTTHLPRGLTPTFDHTFVLWEIKFEKDIVNVFDMAIGGALPLYSIFPSLTTNPSQDYLHLKDKRALIQSNGYLGLRAPSSRTTNDGHMVVLFEDQSQNVLSIQPYTAEFRLITDRGAPFKNHVLETMDFTSGEVRTSGPYLPAWQRVRFNH